VRRKNEPRPQLFGTLPEKNAQTSVRSVSQDEKDALDQPVESTHPSDRSACQSVRDLSDLSVSSFKSTIPLDAEYVHTMNGLGYRTGKRIERDMTGVSPAQRERTRFTDEVITLEDGETRYYYLHMLTPATPEEVEAWFKAKRR